MTDTPDQLAGIGAHRPDDKRGWLVFEYLPNDVQRAEDSTLVGDYEQRRWRASVFENRPATDTERLLLEHIGYELPAELTTRVQWLSNGCRNRRWPQLEDDNA